ncbi:hypothetical protein SH449x_001439 [Pirellulaceae bacterium SH449]
MKQIRIHRLGQANPVKSFVAFCHKTAPSIGQLPPNPPDRIVYLHGHRPTLDLSTLAVTARPNPPAPGMQIQFGITNNVHGNELAQAFFSKLEQAVSQAESYRKFC